MPPPSDGTETRWEAWVPTLFQVRYGNRPGTRLRYEVAWKTIRTYLQHRNLERPTDVRYQDCLDYVGWRLRPSGIGLYRAGRNTALVELRVLGAILQEAVRRGFIAANPTRGLNLPRDPARQKPEITIEEEALIRRALVSRPEWMRASFEIAMATGCRLRETSFELDQADLKRNILSIVQKGARRHTTAMPPHLVPILRDLKDKGYKRSCELPKAPAKLWWNFFREIGLPHLSFHCTRVTVISRLARAGVDERLAMRFLGHASTTVHRIYTRLAVPDLAPCISAIAKLHDEALSSSIGPKGQSAGPRTDAADGTSLLATEAVGGHH